MKFKALGFVISAVAVIWIVGMISYFLVPSTNLFPSLMNQLRGGVVRKSVMNSSETISTVAHLHIKSKAQTMLGISERSNQQSIILSRSDNVTAECDARGNLGPCSVILQNPPGSNWLTDRWQAASDMGGTAIPGHHWVILDFGRLVDVDKVIIDWETAHADEYRIEGRQALTDDWRVIYDATVPKSQQK